MAGLVCTLLALSRDSRVSLIQLLTLERPDDSRLSRTESKHGEAAAPCCWMGLRRLFSGVYPSFRSFFTNLWVNEAHNDFIQTLVETGLVGFACAAAYLLLLCKARIRNSKDWRSDQASALRLAAFACCLGLLIPWPW